MDFSEYLLENEIISYEQYVNYHILCIRKNVSLLSILQKDLCIKNEKIYEFIIEAKKTGKNYNKIQNEKKIISDKNFTEAQKIQNLKSYSIVTYLLEELKMEFSFVDKWSENFINKKRREEQSHQKEDLLKNLLYQIQGGKEKICSPLNVYKMKKNCQKILASEKNSLKKGLFDEIYLLNSILCEEKIDLKKFILNIKKILIILSNKKENINIKQNEIFY